MWWRSIYRIEEKLDSFKQDADKRLDNIEKVLILQEANLEKHMERSEHLEILIDRMEESDLKPLRKHVAMVEGGLKLIGLVGILVGILIGFFKLFSFV